MNFRSVAVNNSAVMEFWPLPLEQTIKFFLIRYHLLIDNYAKDQVLKGLAGLGQVTMTTKAHWSLHPSPAPHSAANRLSGWGRKKPGGHGASGNSKECKIILKQSLLTGWLANGIVNLVSSFIKQSRLEPWNEVETSCHEWSDVHKGKIVCKSNRRVRVPVKILRVLVQES